MSLKIISKSLKVASEAHLGQIRKDGKTPYINHPIEVADILVQAGFTNPVIIATANLHDVVEDTPWTLQEVLKEFGKDIAESVDDCSDDKDLPKVERKKHQVNHSPSIRKEAKAVKLADKLSNVSSLLIEKPDFWTDSRALGYGIWAYKVSNAIMVSVINDDDIDMDESAKYQLIYDNHNIAVKELLKNLGREDIDLSNEEEIDVLLEEYYKELTV